MMIKREEVVGKEVIDSSGRRVGVVDDVVIDQEGKASLLVRVKIVRGGSEKVLEYTLPPSNILAVGDVVLVKGIVEVRRK
ncbi:PRC-barrel domain-containing protein [Candidatus Korarchaeum cryptofilum]|nr:PRC-barrel domain-containing protein [Candidatus Korarchaeum cryptofilum]